MSWRVALAAGAFALVAAGAAAPGAAAQTRLTLEEAMARARAVTPAARAVAAASREADERVRQARAGYLPRVDLSERVQRGDQPVFVFSSLLSQRQFTAARFAIDALNHPAPVNNIQTTVSVEQPIFDAGRTRLAVRGAELGRELASAARDGAGTDLALGAARAFVRVLQLEAADRAMAAALDAAQSDLARARSRHEVGLVTASDALALEVHLADVRQRGIATAGDLAVARLQLAEAIGAPLDETLMLAPPAALSREVDPGALAREAVTLRADRRQADLRVRLAENARRQAQAAFLPSASVQGGWEFNGSRWTDQRSSWVVGAQVRWNVFSGFGDAARVAEARHAEARAAAEREQLDRLVEVDVRAAAARLDAARAGDAAGRAALAQSQESQRIVRDRYESGLATVTDVLRAAEAVLDAESRATAAAMDVVLQTVALDHAAGRL